MQVGAVRRRSLILENVAAVWEGKSWHCHPNPVGLPSNSVRCRNQKDDSRTIGDVFVLEL